MLRNYAGICATIVVLMTLMIAGCSESSNVQENEVLNGETNDSLEEDVRDQAETDHVSGDLGNEEVIDPVNQFDRVGRHFIDGITEVEINNDTGMLKGFVSDEGELLVQPAFAETKFYIGMSSASSGFTEGLAPVKKEGKWGYINVQGETVIDFIYDEAGLFMGDRAAVMDGEKYGLIDSEGTWIVLPAYDQIRLVNGVGVVQIDGKFGFIDMDGHVLVEPIYEFVDLQRSIDYESPYVYVYQEGLIGVVKIVEGEVSTVAPPTYSKLFPFREGLAQFVIFHHDEQGQLEHYITAGYMDETGKETVRFERLPYELGSLSEGKITIQNEQGEWGYVDLDKQVVIPYQYEEAGAFYDDMAIVTVDGKQGAIDPAGNWILEPRYVNIAPLDLYFIVQDDEGKYLISSDDGTKMSDVYDDIGRGGDLRPVKKDDKIGFIDDHGEEVIPLLYDECYTFAFWEGYAAVRKEDEWFYIDAEGSRLGESTYDEVGLFIDNYAEVRTGDKWGVIDQNQEIVVPIQYEEVTIYDDGLILLRENGKYRFERI